MNRKPLARKLAAAALTLVATGGALTATTTGASAVSYDDNYTASFLGGKHSAQVTFRGADSVRVDIQLRDGAGDRYCTAVKIDVVHTDNVVHSYQAKASCDGRSSTSYIDDPGTGVRNIARVEFRAITGNTVGNSISCWNGDDDRNNDNIPDFCS